MDRIFFSYFNREDIGNIVDGLAGKNEYICTIPYSDEESELLITRVVERFMENVDREKQQQFITIIINELIYNAHKINALHSLFNENKLDLTDKDDFKRGLSLLSDGEYYKAFKKKEQYIKITIKVTRRELYISIENSVPLSMLEKVRYKKLLEYCDKFDNLEQVFYDNPNISDSVDFGTVIALLMLKQKNLSKEAVIVSSKESVTLTELTIPFIQLPKNIIDNLTDEIISEIKSLPQFPESIKHLQQEVMDPDWDYERITDNILGDTALTAEILRLVNSPVYRVGDKIDKISLAVKKIGINGLKSILYNFGSMSILESRYNINKINRYKEHLFQVALISSYIANYKKLNEFAEDIYIAALMHDMGKIIVQALNCELSNKITENCREQMISEDAVEKLSEGYNHSLVGARLAEKWEFPTKYIHAIKFHHLPLNAPDEYKIITYCVYLGNEITQIIEGKSKFSNINSSILKFFGLNSTEAFDSLMEELKKEGLLIY